LKVLTCVKIEISWVEARQKHTGEVCDEICGDLCGVHCGDIGSLLDDGFLWRRGPASQLRQRALQIARGDFAEFEFVAEQFAARLPGPVVHLVGVGLNHAHERFESLQREHRRAVKK
jgi:hypothetical protein